MAQKKKLPRGIDRRRNGWYRARISVDGRQYLLGEWPTITDAKTALNIAWAQKAAGTFIPPAERRRLRKAAREREATEQVTVSQWADVWLESLADGPIPRTPGTIRTYRSNLDVHVLPLMGEKRLIEVTEKDINNVVDAIRVEGGPWANVARTLRSMFHTAADKHVGGLTESPVKVSIPKAPAAKSMSGDKPIPTPDQVRQIAENMPANMGIAVMLAAWCALRLGEVFGLQRQDFSNLNHPDKASVSVRRQWSSKATPPAYADPKAGSARTVAIPASLVPVIVAHLDRFTSAAADAPLIPSVRDPERPMSQSAFDRAWRDARKPVYPGLRFHDLRHVGLTTYAQQGATLQELMRRGGHKSIEVAMRYQHADDARDRALTGQLDALIHEIKNE